MSLGLLGYYALAEVVPHVGPMFTVAERISIGSVCMVSCCEIRAVGNSLSSMEAYCSFFCNFCDVTFCSCGYCRKSRGPVCDWRWRSLCCCSCCCFCSRECQGYRTNFTFEGAVIALLVLPFTSNCFLTIQSSLLWRQEQVAECFPQQFAQRAFLCKMQSSWSGGQHRLCST